LPPFNYYVSSFDKPCWSFQGPSVFGCLLCFPSKTFSPCIPPFPPPLPVSAPPLTGGSPVPVPKIFTSFLSPTLRVPHLCLKLFFCVGPRAILFWAVTSTFLRCHVSNQTPPLFFFFFFLISFSLFDWFEPSLWRSLQI